MFHALPVNQISWKENPNDLMLMEGWGETMTCIAFVIGSGRPFPSPISIIYLTSSIVCSSQAP
jgi:hypothetical protein